jgi:Na+/H+-dicarboxylate symporter
VPGVGLITLALVLEQAGLPVEGIALIIGVDRLLDMVRTAVNFTGDDTVSLIVANCEKKFDVGVYLNPRADHDEYHVDDSALPRA